MYPKEQLKAEVRSQNSDIKKPTLGGLGSLRSGAYEKTISLV
jgi:hypothetical protein